MIGFIPLPLSDEKVDDRRRRAADAGDLRGDVDALGDARARAHDAGSFTHVEGIRENGVMRYLQSWIPDVPKALLPMIDPARDPRQFMRLISLSVRLYANMLAGHMLILVLHRPDLPHRIGSCSPVVRRRVARLFYLFEVVIVVTIQAYIFAALSAIYIGSAIEPEH